MKENVFITGGSGFLAKNLVETLIEKYNITLVTRSNKTREILLDKYKSIDVIVINWRDQSQVHNSLKNADYIVHSGAMVPTRSQSNNFKIIKSSLMVAKKIIFANLTKLKKLIFISTLRTCINTENIIQTDNTIYNFYKFDTAYGKSKYLTEKYFLKYKNHNKFQISFCCPGHIVGPETSEISKSNEFIYNIFKKKICFYTKTNYAIVDISDVCKSISLLLESTSTNEKYLICKRNPSMLELIDTCEEIQKQRKIKIYLPLLIINLVSLTFEFFNKYFKIKNIPINRSSYHFAKLNCKFEGNKIEEKGLNYTDLGTTIDKLYNFYKN